MYFDAKQVEAERKGKPFKHPEYLKGVMEIFDVQSVQKVKEKKLKIVYSEKNFEMEIKLNSTEERDLWIQSFELLQKHLQIKYPERKKKEASWKPSEVSQDCFCDLYSLGYFANEHRLEADDMFACKKIKINSKDVSNQDLAFRMAHSIVVVNEVKSWMFLISSRPLNQIAYYEKELQLESRFLPTWCTFDTIYVSNEENKNETSYNNKYEMK